MTEKSWFWAYPNKYGDPVGHSQADYDEDEYQLFVSLGLVNKRTAQGPVFSRYNPWFLTGTESGNLAPTNPAGTTIRIASGVAIVDGSVYVSTADKDFDASAVEYHTIVLRKSQSGGTDKTTRLAHLHQPGSYVALTQDATTWEIPIARAISNGAALTTFIDDREFVNNNVMIRSRKGGNTVDNWSTYGSLHLNTGPTMIQCGATGTPSTALTVEFPKMFGGVPLVFVTPFNYAGASPTHSAIIYISSIKTTSFTVNVASTTNIAGYNWFAIGPVYYGIV
jgi:hypothetical protein